jgi:hypothetical protein
MSDEARSIEERREDAKRHVRLHLPMRLLNAAPGDLNWAFEAMFAAGVEAERDRLADDENRQLRDAGNMLANWTERYADSGANAVIALWRAVAGE